MQICSVIMLCDHFWRLKVDRKLPTLDRKLPTLDRKLPTLDRKLREGDRMLQTLERT